MNNEEPILPQLQRKTLTVPSTLPSQESFQELQQSFDKPKLTLSDILSKSWDELDKQQVFDQIAEHLLSQSKKARNPSTTICEYQSSDGCQCAVGCLIPDEEYSRDADLAIVKVKRAIARVGCDILVPMTIASFNDYHATFEDIKKVLEIADI